MSSPTSLSETIISVLSAENAIRNVISTRMYRMRAPQNTIQPYIIVWVPTHQQVGHLKGMTSLENPIVRFDFYGTNFLTLDQLRAKVIQVMEQPPLNAYYRFGTELYEDDTRYYHLMADFSVWYDRN